MTVEKSILELGYNNDINRQQRDFSWKLRGGNAAGKAIIQTLLGARYKRFICVRNPTQLLVHPGLLSCQLIPQTLLLLDREEKNNHSLVNLSLTGISSFYLTFVNIFQIQKALVQIMICYDKIQIKKIRSFMDM